MLTGVIVCQESATSLADRASINSQTTPAVSHRPMIDFSVTGEIHLSLTMSQHRVAPPGNNTARYEFEVASMPI